MLGCLICSKTVYHYICLLKIIRLSSIANIKIRMSNDFFTTEIIRKQFGDVISVIQLFI